VTELAGCVIKDEQGRILLIHRKTSRFDHWEIPGGKIEDETPQAAAKRELMEELGVEVVLGKKLAQKEFSDKAGDWHYTWFEAKIEKGKPKIMEPKKFSEWNYFDLRQLASLDLSVGVQAFLTMSTP
jgi:8-oxo-dGTP diphosphatase